MAKKVWLGETTCDICHHECKDTLYDAKIIFGPWTTMCEDCFTKHSWGKLGPGYGQRYLKNPKTNKFEKFIG